MMVGLDIREKDNNMTKRVLLFLAFLAVVFASCRSTRTIQKAIVTRDTTIVADTPDTITKLREDSLKFIKESYQQLLSNRINFTTFSAKMDVDYQGSDGKKYDVNAHVRMYRDSVIWVSVTAILGIEGLRAFVTKDSVIILNKQDKVYTKRSLAYLQEVTALPLDLHSLQDLIVGNPVFLDSAIQSYNRTTGIISLYNKGEFFKNLFTISEEGKLPLSSKLDDLDEQRSRTCFLKYDEYENKKGPNFPSRREINVSEKSNLSIKLNFRQYEFNETLSFPFSIPKSYREN
ncbi:MAG: DUF4292 domain-containing protein [Chitinophagaceae bacterium]|nr:DUF4292 domain-containing protein [Chitinophagaceae bacterium]